jgi:lysophospholipase L1-like esterase
MRIPDQWTPIARRNARRVRQFRSVVSRSRRTLALVSVSGLALAALAVDREPRVAQAAPRVPSSAESAGTSAVKHVTKKASDVTVGHLEHPSRLAAMFARLQELDAHTAQSDVRIVQLGDSHTASDYGTSVARVRLATRFGDGGRGFLPMGQPYRRLFQAGEAVTRGVGFEPVKASLLGVRPAGEDGFYGPSGVAMEARAPSSSMTSELTASAEHYDVSYLGQPGGGSFEVFVDGKSRGRIRTDQATRTSASQSFAVARGAHSLETRALGDGPVRIFGVRLDDDATGITFDSLGMNGAKATTLLTSDDVHLREQIARLAPALVILAYGTNEAGDSTTTPDQHATAMVTLAGHAKAGAPGASCVMLGPPDRDGRTMTGIRSLPKLTEIIAAQRRAADDAGCAFFDQQATMGAPDSIGRWASESPPRARRDLVHLTRAGYATLAEAFVADMVKAYDGWKRDAAVATR